MNSYFAVEKPIRVFRHVGHSLSNTWVGASRAITTVKEAINARHGDEIHALVGGTFLVRDGEFFEISLRQPKPLLEKSYGGRVSDAKFMESYVKRGYAKEISKPTEAKKYTEARQAVSGNRLPDLHREIIHVEDSPLLTKMRTILFGAEDEANEVGIPFQITAVSDVGCDTGPKIQMTIGDEKIVLTGGAAGIDDHVISVEGPGRLSVGSENSGYVSMTGDRKRVFFRMIDDVENPMATAADMLVDVVKAVALECKTVPTA